MLKRSIWQTLKFNQTTKVNDMKSTKTLMCAMAVGAMIFAAGKVSAVPGVLNLSGTALNEIESTRMNITTTSTNFIYIGKVTKKSFNTKFILSLLKQATEYYLGGNQGWFTNKASQLVFDPEAYNTNANASANYSLPVYGIFYVTNTSTSAVYPLDGVDINGYYFSFVEFDSYGFYNLTGEYNLGFWHDFALGENYVESYKEDDVNDVQVTLSSKATLHGLLYIHDNPYDYNITDNPGEVFDNTSALIIRGLCTFNYSHNSTTQTESFTLSGSGDGYFYYADFSNPVITGKVTFKSKGSYTPAP